MKAGGRAWESRKPTVELEPNSHDEEFNVKGRMGGNREERQTKHHSFWTIQQDTLISFTELVIEFNT